MSINRVFVAGTSILTAADMNGLQAAWDTYSPTSTNFTIGNGTLAGRYLQIGKTLLIRINFAAGSTTTYTGSQMTVSLPFATHGTGQQELSVRLSTAGIIGIADVAAGASVASLAIPAATGNLTLVPMTSTSLNPGTTGGLVINGVLELA